MNKIIKLLFIMLEIAMCITIAKGQNRDSFHRAIDVIEKRKENQKGDKDLIRLNNYDAANVYGKWAQWEAEKGEYQFAEELYQKALNQNELSGDIRFILHLNLSELFLRRGMYSSAKNIMDLIEPTNNKQHIAYLGNLASYYAYVGDFNYSISLYETILRNEFADNNQKLQASVNLCYIYIEQGMYAQALAILKARLDEQPNTSRYKYLLLSHKAIAESWLGYNKIAIQDIDECLRWQKKNIGINHQDYVINLRKKAEILLRAGDKESALLAFKKYISEEKKYAVRQFKFFTEQQRLDYWANKKSLISEVLALEEIDPNYLYDVALFRRQVALLGKNCGAEIDNKLSYSMKQVAHNLKKNEFAIEFIKYEKDSKNKYGALLLTGSDKKHVKFISLWSEDSIKAYKIGGNRLDSALCSKVRADKDKVYQNNNLSEFVWDKLLSLIPEGSTIYFAPDGILHLLAIEYLPTVNNGKYELHRLTTTALLAEKKRKTIKSNTKALIVGGMDYDIIPPKDSSITIQANHDAYNYLRQNKKMLYFTYLLGSKIESDSIEKYLSDADKFEDIDEASLKYKMGKYNNIHLATHGYSWHVDVPSIPYAFRDSITEDKSLLASGIAISGANWIHLFSKREDGLLSARELCEMDLTGVDLVVASSCQSAQGRVSDEGPTGLVRGLKKAGVKTIIASLWPVSDKGTMLLMQFFYDEWREGKGKDGKGCSKTRALHLAQKRLKEIEGNPVKVRTYNTSNKTGTFKIVTTKYDTPYYWAPFIIIDDI